MIKRTTIYILLLLMANSLFAEIDINKSKCNCHGCKSTHNEKVLYKLNIAADPSVSNSCCCSKTSCIKRSEAPSYYVIPELIQINIVKTTPGTDNCYSVNDYKILNYIKIRAGPQKPVFKQSKTLSLYLINMSFLC